MSKFLQPGNGGIRQPTDNAKENGKCLNPPRYQKNGGFSGPQKIAARNPLGVVPPGKGPSR